MKETSMNKIHDLTILQLYSTVRARIPPNKKFRTHSNTKHLEVQYSNGSVLEWLGQLKLTTMQGFKMGSKCLEWHPNTKPFAN